MEHYKNLIALCLVVSSLCAMSDVPCKEKNKMHDRLRVKIEHKKKIVDLSGLGLTDDDIKNIDTLQVEYLGKMVAMRSLPAFALLLNNNSLSSLPKSLGTIQNVHYLDMKGNHLRAISDVLAKLSNLLFLDVSNNQISKLPSSIGDLAQLKFLNLNDNKLDSLPQSFAQLKSLKFLNLNGNSFTVVPDVLTALPSLSVLNLSDNHFEKEPNDSIGQLTKTAHTMIWKKNSAVEIKSE